MYGSINHFWFKDDYGVHSYDTPVKVQLHSVKIYSDGLNTYTQYNCVLLINDFPDGKCFDFNEGCLFKTPEEWWKNNGGMITPHGIVVGEFNEEKFSLLERENEESGE